MIDSAIDHIDFSDVCLPTSHWPATPYYWNPSFEHSDKDQKLIEHFWSGLVRSVANLDRQTRPQITKTINEYSDMLIEDSAGVEGPDQIWLEYFSCKERPDFISPSTYYELGCVIQHFVGVLNLYWIWKHRKKAWEDNRDWFADDTSWDEQKHDAPDSLTPWEKEHNLSTPRARVKFFDQQMVKLGID